ncbi:MULTISPECIES: hypothetical protein [unclassified Bradyrhizobium]|uniref:hypothetical protein n=1 Tax=unclassified Bradyrhizobium TaxID=2631580 RepID=UPI0028E3FA68|nr:MULTISPECIES: hypothetical protein [unclassified Bradyrhizobium]
MERWQFIRWGIAASVLVHLLIFGGAVVSTSVRPYEMPKSDEIAVNIVDADEPQKTPEPLVTPSPSPTPELVLPQPAPSALPAAAAPPPPSPPQEAKETPTPQAPAAPAAKQPVPAASPKAAKLAARSEVKSAAKQTPPPAPVPAPSYVPPEPDLTVKYGVMLGLPEPLSPLPRAGASEDGKEAGSVATTNLAPNLETALREKVRSCARLPVSLSLSDNVLIRLRFGMTPDGRLATEPEVIEVVAASKAIQLKESAVQALNACQPYAMLPPDRYNEWKIIEMSFTPRDFVR